MAAKGTGNNPRAEFRTTLRSAGKTATGIEIPPSVVESLGAGKRPPVRVTINGYTYRNTVAVMGGAYLVGVSAEHRKGAGVVAGDDLDVLLELDTEPREINVPADLAAALKAHPSAWHRFEALSYSRKQGYVQPIDAAKTPETRQRRIDKAIIELGAE
jgi:hypothetical protein